jgi:hypothetical protein
VVSGLVIVLLHLVTITIQLLLELPEKPLSSVRNDGKGIRFAHKAFISKMHDSVGVGRFQLAEFLGLGYQAIMRAVGTVKALEHITTNMGGTVP